MLFSRMFSPLVAVALSLGAALAHAQADKAPDALVKEVATDVLETAKVDKDIKAGDLKKISALVDAKVLPYVDLEKMTGRSLEPRDWRQATPDQKKRLQDEFKTLLIRTYSGALTNVKDQTVEIEPSRVAVNDSNPYTVKTKVRGGTGDAHQLNYDLEKSASGWKIVDLSVDGVSLVAGMKSNFAQAIGAGGIDGLIEKLAKLNKTAGTAKN